MYLSQIDNPYSLNIFCDASIKKLGKSFDGCYGAIAVVNNTVIDEIYRIASNSTNNNSEIKAVRAAVMLAYRHGQNFDVINIFSDSQISIFGLRERFTTWNLINGTLYGTSDQPIKSQEIFVEIIGLLKSYPKRINLWHQKGHVKNTFESLVNAQHVFAASNRIRENVDLELIKYLSKYNNIVDDKSRKVLYRDNGSHNYHDPLIFYSTGFEELVEEYNKRNLGGTPYEEK